MGIYLLKTSILKASYLLNFHFDTRVPFLILCYIFQFRKNGTLCLTGLITPKEKEALVFFDILHPLFGISAHIECFDASRGVATF